MPLPNPIHSLYPRHHALHYEWQFQHPTTCTLVTLPPQGPIDTLVGRKHQAGQQECVASLCCPKPQIPYSILTACRLGDSVGAVFYWIWNTWNLRSLSHLGTVTAGNMVLQQLWQLLAKRILQSGIGSQFLTSRNPNDSNLITSTACHHAHVCRWTFKDNWTSWAW